MARLPRFCSPSDLVLGLLLSTGLLTAQLKAAQPFELNGFDENYTYAYLAFENAVQVADGALHI